MIVIYTTDFRLGNLGQTLNKLKNKDPTIHNIM